MLLVAELGWSREGGRAMTSCVAKAVCARRRATENNRQRGDKGYDIATTAATNNNHQRHNIATTAITTNDRAQTRCVQRYRHLLSKKLGWALGRLRIEIQIIQLRLRSLQGVQSVAQSTRSSRNLNHRHTRAREREKQRRKYHVEAKPVGRREVGRRLVPDSARRRCTGSIGGGGSGRESEKSKTVVTWKNPGRSRQKGRDRREERRFPRRAKLERKDAHRF